MTNVDHVDQFHLIITLLDKFLSIDDIINLSQVDKHINLNYKPMLYHINYHPKLPYICDRIKNYNLIEKNKVAITGAACQVGDTRLLNYLIKKGININSSANLYIACETGHFNVVKLLYATTVELDHIELCCKLHRYKILQYFLKNKLINKSTLLSLSYKFHIPKYLYR